MFTPLSSGPARAGRVVLPLIVALLTMVSVAHADIEDQLETIEREYKAVTRIVKERRPGQTRYIDRHFANIVNALSKLRDLYSRAGDRDGKDRTSKHLDLFKRFRADAGKHYIELCEEFAGFHEAAGEFGEKATKAEKKILDAFDRFNSAYERRCDQVADGKQSAVEALEAVRQFRQRTIPAMLKGLEQIHKAAVELIGRDSDRLEDLEDHADEAEDQRDGDIDQLEELCETMDDSVERWNRDLARYVTGLRKKYAALLEDPDEHPGFEDRMEKLADLEDELKDFLQSDKGFAFEGKALMEGINDVAEAALDDDGFDQADLDALMKQLTAIGNVCREYRMRPPRWWQDCGRILQSLKGRGEQLERARTELADLARKVEQFRRHCDQIYRRAVSMLDAADEVDELEAAIDFVNEAERRIEAQRRALNAEFEQVQRLLQQLARIPRLRGPGDAIVRNIFTVCEAINERAAGIREQLDEDPETRALLEGFDGD